MRKFKMKSLLGVMVIAIMWIAATSCSADAVVFSDDFNYSADPIDDASGPGNWSMYTTGDTSNVYSLDTGGYMRLVPERTSNTAAGVVQAKNNFGESVGINLNDGAASFGWNLSRSGNYYQRFQVNLTTAGMWSDAGMSFLIDPTNYKIGVYWGSTKTEQSSISTGGGVYDYTLRLDISTSGCKLYYRSGIYDPSELGDAYLVLDESSSEFANYISSLSNLRVGFNSIYFWPNSTSDGQSIDPSCYIKNVSLSQVPEPSILGVLAVGLAVLRKRRNKAHICE